MRKLFLFFLLLLTGCAGMQAAPQEQTMSISKIIVVPGASEEQIYNNTKGWVNMFVQLKNADSNTGIILAKGEVAYPSPPIDRIEYTFVFTMKNEIRDNKDTVTFEKIMLRSPKQYLPLDTGAGEKYIPSTESTPTAKRDVEAAQNAIGYIADNLQSYLQTRH
jgi:hypothetical protein